MQTPMLRVMSRSCSTGVALEEEQAATLRIHRRKGNVKIRHRETRRLSSIQKKRAADEGSAAAPRASTKSRRDAGVTISNAAASPAARPPICFRLCPCAKSA